MGGTSATFKVSADRNLAIKYDTNISLSAQADAGGPESLRMYADAFRIFTATTAVGLTERFTILNTGNVGIGTTSPTGRLMLYQSSAGNVLQNIVSNQGGSTQVGINLSPSMTDAEVASNPAQASIYATDSNYGANIIFATKATGAVGNALTTRLTITSGGNVQIDDNGSSSKLAVRGGNSTYPASSSASYTLSLNDPTSSAIDVGGSLIFQGFKTSTTSLGNFAGIVGKKENGTAGNESGFLGFLTSDASGTFSEKMRITSVGDVSIGHPGASGQRLRVQGASTGSSDYGLVVANSSTASTMLVRNDGYGFLLASSWAYGSDRRMKENILDVENGVDMVLKMKPKHFDYINGQKDNLGFIAQDVQEIIPQAVSISDEKTGMLALKTDFLVPYLVKAIQEQQSQIKELQTEIQTLKNK